MIIPAIIPKTITDLKDSLAKVSFSEVIQIDVVDGQFVANVSWPFEPTGEVVDAKGLITGKVIEVDLMVAEPLTTAQKWIEIGVQRLIFHIESLEDPTKAIDLAKEHDVEIFFSISNDTDLSLLHPYITQIDGVQLMGIAEIGSQGQPFDNRVIERIVTLKALYPTLTISIDGGVNADTIYSLRQAGADRFVSGSAILSSDNPEVVWQKLLKIIS